MSSSNTRSSAESTVGDATPTTASSASTSTTTTTTTTLAPPSTKPARPGSRRGVSSSSNERGSVRRRAPSMSDRGGLSPRGGAVAPGVIVSLDPDADDAQQTLKEMPQSAEESELLSMIESEDLGPSIRALFEGGREVEFVEVTNKFVLQKDAEIEELCNLHYEEFVSSVDELLEVRSETGKLSESLLDINANIQQSGQQLVEESKMLQEKRLMQYNVRKSLDALNHCLYVLLQCRQIKLIVEERKYYEARKVADRLQSQYLSMVEDYEIGRYISDWLVRLNSTIKKSVTSDFNQWMVVIREQSERVGENALAVTAKQLEHTSISFPPSASPNRSLLLKLVDFTRLYRAVHTYEELGLFQDLHEYYKKNRRLQAGLVMQSFQAGQSTDFLGEFRRYLYRITGFFVIEYTVMHSGQALLGQSTLDSIWKMCLTKINSILHEQLVFCKQASVLETIKSLMLIFADTMQSYLYDTSSMSDLLNNMLQPFARLSIAQMQNEFDANLSSKNLTVLHDVRSLEDYNQLVAVNLGLTKSADEVVVPSIFPTTMPYSNSVPGVVTAVRKCVDKLHRFAEGLPDAGTFLEKTSEELVEALKGSMLKLLEPRAGLDSAFTLYSDLDSYVRAGAVLNKLNRRWSPQTATDFVTMFEAVKNETLLYIGKRCEMTVLKGVRDLYAEVDWLPTTTTQEPRGVVKKFVARIDRVLGVARIKLPKEALPSVCVRMQAALSRSYLSVLTDSKVKRFNYNAIVALEQDLMLVDMLAMRLAPAMANTNRSIFAELRQILDLIMSANLEGFLDVATRKERYGDVNDLKRLAIILNKFKEDKQAKQKTGSATQLRRKQVDAFIKRLQQMARSKK